MGSLGAARRRRHSPLRGARHPSRDPRRAHAGTGFRRRLSVIPRREADRVKAALERAVAEWQGTHPGLAVAEAGSGWELLVPRALASGHESHFPLVLADFLALVEHGSMPPSLAADTLAKYALLARASTEADRHQG